MNETETLRPLGTSNIPGATTANDRFQIKVKENAPAWDEAVRSAGEVWVGFGADGKIVTIERCEEECAEDSPKARAAAIAHPNAIAICDFMASHGDLHYTRSLSVLTGKEWPGDATLGFDGEITYGNGETVRYVRGIPVRSAHEEMALRQKLRDV